MVSDPKLNPPGAAVGQLDDGSINIGPADKMRAKFELARAESAAADVAVHEAQFGPQTDEPDISDLDDYD